MAVPATKGIIFDCFGVLYVGSLAGLYDMTPREKWNELHDLSVGSDYGYIARDEYLAALAGLTGRPLEEIEAQQAAAHVRNDGLVEYIRELKKTFKIAMLSNVGRDLVESLFSESERAELFDAIVLSYEEGIVKPHPRIYQITAERLGLAPGECLMIDDLQKNIDGADAAGMRGLVYSDLPNLKSDLSRVLSA